MIASHMGVLVQVLAILLLTQHPANLPGKAIEDSSNTWALAAHIGAGVEMFEWEHQGMKLEFTQ